MKDSPAVSEPVSSVNTPELRHSALLADGAKHQREGRLREAWACFRLVLRENPLHPDALNCLALLAKNLGNPARAKKLIRAAIETGRGNTAVYCNNLANFLRQDNPNEARQLYLKAVEIDPAYCDAWLNLASYEDLHGNPANAIESLQAGLDKCPGDLLILQALKARLLQRERFSEALPVLKLLIEKKPDDPELWVKLGLVWSELRDPGKATRALLQCLKLDPENSAAKLLLSKVLIGCAEAHEAEALLIEAAKTDDRAYAVLGNVYKDLGYMDLALDCYAKSLIHYPSHPEQSNFLYTLLYDPAHDHQEVAEEHRNWGRTYADPLRPAKISFDLDRDPDRPLQIGYVSGHYWDHAVSLFSLPMIQAHDPTAFQLHLYYSGRKHDWATDAFRAHASQWHEIEEKSDADVARLIQAERIDILVDLAGHIGGNRLLVLARKPAPIQVTYLGYQATTGMQVMDYRLTDSIADPPGLTDSLYVEKLIRLDPSFFAYRPSEYAPPVAPLPAESSGHITFGCLNNPSKTGPWLVKVWAELLRSTADSQLMLLGPSRQDADPRVMNLFREEGIDPRRIVIMGKRTRLDYLHLYDRIDIGLDPFPFTGHTTTCDALWQGAPVVTLAGQTYAGRMSTSTLTQARCPQWIANSPEEYVQIGLGLASEIPTLAKLRKNMREHLASAPILDAKAFTKGLESAYRKMWHEYLAGAINV